MELFNRFNVKDLVIVTGEGPNANRMVRLVAYIQPGDVVFHEDGYWVAEEKGAWIIQAEDLVRKIRFRGEVISYLAQVDADEIRALGEEDEGYTSPKSLGANVVSFKATASSMLKKKAFAV